MFGTTDVEIAAKKAAAGVERKTTDEDMMKRKVKEARVNGDDYAVMHGIKEIPGINQRQAFIVRQIPAELLKGLMLEFGGYRYQQHFQRHGY